MDCLFCEIIKGNIPSSKVYEDEYCYAFRDINPQAPVHVLVVPKLHVASADGINADNSSYVAAIFEAIPKIAAAAIAAVESAFLLATEASQTPKSSLDAASTISETADGNML